MNVWLDLKNVIDLTLKYPPEGNCGITRRDTLQKLQSRAARVLTSFNSYSDHGRIQA